MKFLLILALSLLAWAARAQNQLNRPLQRELDSIRALDQKYRRLIAAARTGKADSLAAALHMPKSQLLAYALTNMQRVDSSNLRRVEEIIWRYGYPGKSLVGSPTNEAVWYVIQHSSKIPQYLLWVKGAAERGEIPYRLYAQMLDRKLMGDGQEQVYGTQGTGYTVLDHATGQQHTLTFIWPIKDPTRVDKRRHKAGFSSTLTESSTALGIPYQPVSLEYALWMEQEAIKLAQDMKPSQAH